MIWYVKDFDKIEILGQTNDDACGEAFDKVAKILGMGYPGGPFIEQLAKQGDKKRISFSCSGAKKQLDFSFSGIKTAVLYRVKDKSLTLKQKRDIAASFQETSIDALIKKSLLACKLKRTKRLVIGGGVVANKRLREKFSEESRKNAVNCYFPASRLCTDNAAMIAACGYYRFQASKIDGLDLDVVPSLKLA